MDIGLYRALTVTLYKRNRRYEKAAPRHTEFQRDYPAASAIDLALMAGRKENRSIQRGCRNMETGDAEADWALG